MNQFGLAPIKKEGEAAHPDIYINSCDMSDEWYKRQLEAYIKWSGDEESKKTCVRDYLWL